jgi:hypothetical protein
MSFLLGFFIGLLLGFFIGLFSGVSCVGFSPNPSSKYLSVTFR